MRKPDATAAEVAGAEDHAPDGGPVVARATRASRIASGLLLVLVPALASMPWWADASLSSTVVEFLYFVAIAQMWNLLGGYGGLVSIGQQAYIGIGGYVLAAIALHTTLHPFLSIPIAGLVAGLVAYPVSRLLFRLNGAYFAVGTWVVAEVFRLLLANYQPLGGGTGISITSAMAQIDPWWREAMILWSASALAILSVAGVYLFLRSSNGLALTAIRDSEVASESLGVRVPRVKLAVYLVSSLGCGMAGALIYLVKLRISPDAAFSVEWTALAFLMVIIGGFGTIEGPIIGAMVYFLLRWALGDLGTVYLIALGVLAIAVMLVERKGIWGAVQKRVGVEVFPVQRRLVERPGVRRD